MTARGVSPDISEIPSSDVGLARRRVIDLGRAPASRHAGATAVSVVLHTTVLLLAAYEFVTPPAAPAPPRLVVYLSGVQGGGEAPGGPAPAAAPAAAPPARAEPPPPPPQAVPHPHRAVLPQRPPPRRPPASDRVPAASANAPAATVDAAAAAAPADGTGGGGPLAAGSGSGAGGSGTGRGSGDGSGPGGGSAVDDYLQHLRARLETVKQYPLLARRMGAHGVAMVSIVIDRDGQPRAVQLTGSSGNPLLDDEAVDMVARAAPFKPLPADITESILRVMVPVSFDLGG